MPTTAIGSAALLCLVLAYFGMRTRQLTQELAQLTQDLAVARRLAEDGTRSRGGVHCPDSLVFPSERLPWSEQDRLRALKALSSVSETGMRSWNNVGPTHRTRLERLERTMRLHLCKDAPERRVHRMRRIQLRGLLRVHYGV